MTSLRRRTSRQDGFTLIEVMTTSAILLVVIAAALSLLVAAQRSTSFSTRRGETQDDIRLAMDRLTKDLRQLTKFNTTWATHAAWSGHDLDFQTYTVNSAAPVRVHWWVSGATLYRQEGSGTAMPVLQSIAAPGSSGLDLFECGELKGTDAATGTPVPWQMTVTIVVELANPGGTYSTRSEVQFRNLNPPQPT